jgi:hypothetical protein
VSVVNTSASDKSASPSGNMIFCFVLFLISFFNLFCLSRCCSQYHCFCAEALGNADGHDSTISADVVKESESANVSSIPPTG